MIGVVPSMEKYRSNHHHLALIVLTATSLEIWKLLTCTLMNELIEYRRTTNTLGQFVHDGRHREDPPTQTILRPICP